MKSSRRDFNTTLLATFIGAGLTWIHGATTASAEPDRFGGWKGKHFKATGFFCVEKDERWWHVTPEGNALHSFGMKPVRPEWDDPKVPNDESLAIFNTENALNSAPKGVMARTSAAMPAEHGEGRVFCFSPHPELTDGLRHLIPLTVRWAAKKATNEKGLSRCERPGKQYTPLKALEEVLVRRQDDVDEVYLHPSLPSHFRDSVFRRKA